MKSRRIVKSVKEILQVLLLISWLQSVVGRSIRCSLTKNIERYDPKHPEAEIECIPCPDCPEGQGLSPQCGSRIPKDSKIECKLCLVNETYSNNHGIESCKPCQECHLKNVIQHCTESQNRICGIKCPQGSFLDDNNVCQECYFCCGNVSEAYRRQGCKDIGMDRNRQCEKTEQNQRCKRALDKLKPTISPTDKKPTVSRDRNHDMAEKQATSIPHDTSQKLTISQYPSTSMASHNSTNDLSTEKEKGQKENGTTFLGVVSDVVLGVIVLAVVILVLVALGVLFSKILIYWKRCKSPRTKPEFADNADWIELSQCEPDQDSDNSTSQETGSGVDDGPVNDIPEDVKLDELPLYGVDCILELDCKSLGVKDWRHVASHDKFCRWFSNKDIGTIEQYCGNESPTIALISKLCTYNVSLKTFVDVLQELRRYDVANGIYTWYKNRG